MKNKTGLQYISFKFVIAGDGGGIGYGFTKVLEVLLREKSCVRPALKCKASSLSEYLQNLWHDRGYELVYRMFPCRCGHGFLRKEEEEDNPGQQGAAAAKKKKPKEKPKLNVSTKLVSQKVCGEYFPEVGFTEKSAAIRRPAMPPGTPPRKEPPGVQPAKAVFSTTEVEDCGDRVTGAISLMP